MFPIWPGESRTKFLGSTFLGVKFFLGKNFFGSNFFWVKNFGGQNFLRSKFFGVQIFWGPNFLGSKFFGVKFFWGQNILSRVGGWIMWEYSWAGLGLSLAIKISKNPKNLKNVQKEISGSEEKGDFKCGPAQPNLFLFLFCLVELIALNCPKLP